MRAFLRGGDTFSVSGSSGPINGVGDVLRVYNEGTSTGYVRVGVGPQSASSSDIIVPGRSEVYVQIGFDADTAGASGGSLKAMRGSLR